MVPEAFYPFVENGNDDASTPEEASLAVRHPARIAIFDDPSAAPRVVVIEPSDIRTYLEEITKTVTQLAQEQGGGIPFTVIREVVENLIHAYFMEPTISILDGGNTIRFSDQGPGIRDKRRALEFGTTSATEEMKRYIRGVGSGLPYAQQWLEDKGGFLEVEDNIHQGTVVTVSLRGAGVQGASNVPTQPNAPTQQTPFYQGQPAEMPQQGAWASQSYPQQPYPPQGYPQPYPQPGGWNMQGQGYPQPYAQPWQQGYPQAGYPPQGYPQQGAWPMQQQGYNPQPLPYQQYPSDQAQQPGQPHVSERGLMALDYLRTHDSVGPRDLNALHQLSESTWSRVLTQLEDQGLVSKRGGQKRFLTPFGRQFLGI